MCMLEFFEAYTSAYAKIQEFVKNCFVRTSNLRAASTYVRCDYENRGFQKKAICQINCEFFFNNLDLSLNFDNLGLGLI